MSCTYNHPLVVYVAEQDQNYDIIDLCKSLIMPNHFMSFLRLVPLWEVIPDTNVICVHSIIVLLVFMACQSISCCWCEATWAHILPFLFLFCNWHSRLNRRTYRKIRRSGTQICDLGDVNLLLVSVLCSLSSVQTYLLLTITHVLWYQGEFSPPLYYIIAKEKWHQVMAWNNWCFYNAHILKLPN